MAIVKLELDVTAEQAVGIAQAIREAGLDDSPVMAPFMSGVPEPCVLYAWAQRQVARVLRGDIPDEWVVVKTYESSWVGNEQNGGRDYHKTYAVPSPWGAVEVVRWHCDYWVPNDGPTGSFKVRCGEVCVEATDGEWLRNFKA